MTTPWLYDILFSSWSWCVFQQRMLKNRMYILFRIVRVHTVLLTLLRTLCQSYWCTWVLHLSWFCFCSWFCFLFTVLQFGSGFIFLLPKILTCGNLVPFWYRLVFLPNRVNFLCSETLFGFGNVSLCMWCRIPALMCMCLCLCVCVCVCVCAHAFYCGYSIVRELDRSCGCLIWSFVMQLSNYKILLLYLKVVVNVG